MEPFVPHGVSVGMQFAYWCGSVCALGLIAYVVRLKRENGKLREDKEMSMVNAIKESINNLSTTIKDSTEKFEKALKETRTEFGKINDDMWEHIGELRENVSWLTGQHEANHKTKYEASTHSKKK